MSRSNGIRLMQEIRATPAETFAAFASSRALKTWLCEEAICVPRVAGFVSLWWKDGEYATGELTEFDPGRRWAMTWQGRHESEPGKVGVTLEEKCGATRLTLVHTGFGADRDGVEIRKRWTRWIGNLSAVWGEKDIDQRLVARPSGEPRASLGFFYGPPTRIDALTLPRNSWGIEVAGAPVGSSAFDAGLRPGDVVLSIGGRPVYDLYSFSEALDHVAAGKHTDVSYVHGSRVCHTTVLTSAVPTVLPLPPEDPEAFAEEIARRYRRFDDELDGILSQVTEEMAATRPREGAWSIDEVLAHLIPFERMFHNWLGATVSGFDMIEWIKHPHFWSDGLLEIYPTMAQLREALRRGRAETVAYIRRLPSTFAQTPTYRRMGMILIMDQFHPVHHHEQIRRILAELSPQEPPESSP